MMSPSKNFVRPMARHAAATFSALILRSFLRSAGDKITIFPKDCTSEVLPMVSSSCECEPHRAHPCSHRRSHPCFLASKKAGAPTSSVSLSFSPQATRHLQVHGSRLCLDLDLALRRDLERDLDLDLTGLAKLISGLAFETSTPFPATSQSLG